MQYGISVDLSQEIFKRRNDQEKRLKERVSWLSSVGQNLTNYISIGCWCHDELLSFDCLTFADVVQNYYYSFLFVDSYKFRLIFFRSIFYNRPYRSKIYIHICFNCCLESLQSTVFHLSVLSTVT